MKVCFCSSFLADEKEVINNSKIKPSVATHKFNLNILEGIKKNIGDDLTILNTENVASFPNYKRVTIKKQNNHLEEIGDYTNIGKLNIPMIKDLTETINLYKELKKWVKAQSEDNLYICGYGRRLSHAVAINLLKKKYKNIKTCMFLADLSGKAVSTKQETGNIKQKIVNKLLDFQVNQSIKFDSFVLLTEAMAKYLDIEDKPYTIIEGICSDEFSTFFSDSESLKNEDKIIAYSGVLSKQYNVDVLLEAFAKIKDDTYKLWLFGDGELNDYIKKLSLENPNIIFSGFIPNETLRRELSKTTLLVNPRQNLEEYTKYSFPSKTIEYLTLGKPVISYKLDGIPDEYDDYLFYPQDNTSETLKNKIIEVCELPTDQRSAIGKANICFVKNCKNSTVQTKKMLTMFRNMKG